MTFTILKQSKTTILFFILLTGILFCGAKGALAFGENYNLSPSEYVFMDIQVDKHNVIAGQPVSGTLIVKTADPFTPELNFGDGETKQFKTCDTTTAQKDPSQFLTTCTYSFTHVYKNPGTYSIEQGYISGGSPISGAGGTYTVLAREEVTVVKAPTPSTVESNFNPLKTTSTRGVIGSVTNIIFYIMSGLAVLFVMIGGTLILTAAGSPEQFQKGKKIVLYTVIGYAIMLIARGIVNISFKIIGVDVEI